MSSVYHPASESVSESSHITASEGSGIGAIIFILTSFDADDWWLAEGFYGAFFGGLLTAVFAKMMFDKIEV